MGEVSQVKSVLLMNYISSIDKAKTLNELRLQAGLYSGGVTLQECVNRWFDATGKKKNAVAQKADMKPSQISDIISGRNPDPQFSTVERLARGFELSTTEFLRGPRPEEQAGHEEGRIQRNLEAIERNRILDDLVEDVIAKYPGAADTWQGDVQRAQAALADAAVALARALRRADENTGPASTDARKTGS